MFGGEHKKTTGFYVSSIKTLCLVVIALKTTKLVVSLFKTTYSKNPKHCLGSGCRYQEGAEPL